jgi:hypothetical protein
LNFEKKKKRQLSKEDIAIFDLDLYTSSKNVYAQLLIHFKWEFVKVLHAIISIFSYRFDWNIFERVTPPFDLKRILREGRY